jgi:hypothetical protein
MATDLQICNKALVSLGAGQIASLTEESIAANLCSLLFSDKRDALLRSRPWKFSIKRVQLVENLINPPKHGRARAFDMPLDYLAPLPPEPERDFESLDWLFEGSPLQLITDDSSPLDFRYVSQVLDSSRFDPLFSEALSALLAVELTEPLTQSNTKLANMSALLDEKLGEARRMNAFEQAHHLPPLDRWAAVRQTGRDNTRRWFR